MDAERIITLDMHTHLLEKKVKPRDYWNKVNELGLDAITISEHSELEPGKSYKLLLREKKGDAVLIPGMEVNSDKGHVVAYAEDARIYEINVLKKNPVPIAELIDIAKENNLLLSIAHPWGFDYDSLGLTMGTNKVEGLIRREFIGVEIYNGMVGYLCNFIYDSEWIRKPVNFLDFLDRNRVASKTGIHRVSGKIKTSIDKKRLDVVMRNAKATDLAGIAKFVTAGSDAHSADRIGSGIMKIKTELSELNEVSVLEEMLKKDNIIWSGPPVKEVREGMYERIIDPLTKKEILQGLKYITTKIIKKRISKKKSKIVE